MALPCADQHLGGNAPVALLDLGSRGGAARSASKLANYLYGQPCGIAAKSQTGYLFATLGPSQHQPAWRQLLACSTRAAHVAAQDLCSWGIPHASAGVFAGF